MKTSIKYANWSRRRIRWQRCLTTALVFSLIGLINGLDLVLLKNQLTEESTSANQPLALQSTKVKATQFEVPEGDKKMDFLAEYKQNKLCHSTECRRLSSGVLFKMNQKIDPCDDFYQFACGNYVNTSAPPITDKWLEQVRDILMQELPHTEPKHSRLPNMFYKACMDETSIERLDTKHLHQILHSLGGWPVLDGSGWDSDSSWTWPNLVEKFRRIGYSSNSVVYLSIGVNLFNNTRRIISVDQPSIGLRREYLVKNFNDTLVSAYYDYMVDIAVLLGAEKAAAQRELRKSLQFEIDLARISSSDRAKINNRNVYNLRTIKQLQASYPYVEWLDYINAHMPDGHKVDENEVINLSMPSFFDDLADLLERTQKRVIANYMLWHFNHLSVTFLTEKLRKRHFEFTSRLSGKQAELPRWKDCVDVTLHSLPLAVGSLYTRKYFNQDSKAITLEMANNIRSVFSLILDNVKWMDDITKQEAKKKLQLMATEIGYPDEMLDEAKLEEFYRKLEIDSNNYFESYLNVTLFSKNYLFGTLKMPVNKTDWIPFENLVAATAYYSPTENNMKFPTGILQEPFFDVQRPKYMNYGTIGSLIGHEITHGFDSNGRQFDGSGNAIDWWPAEAKKAYSEKAKCVLEQYGSYEDEQTELSPEDVNTQSEHIADITGIKAAYMAYQEWVARNGEEEQLPGLDYTPEQMFWISAAQSWCVKYGSESQFRIDDHLPGEYRVLGAFTNLQYFSQDFQCHQNAPMNPTPKCEIW